MSDQDNRKDRLKGLPDRADKNYQVVREIFEMLQSKKLLVHEAYTVLEQVKATIGYTSI
jgi:hypothetical protein